MGHSESPSFHWTFLGTWDSSIRLLLLHNNLACMDSQWTENLNVRACGTPPYEWVCSPQNRTRKKAFGMKKEEERKSSVRDITSGHKRWSEEASLVVVDEYVMITMLAK